MRHLIALLACLALPVHAATFDGHWETTLPTCQGAQGSYAERCAAGEHDEFELDLWVEGNRVCGFHLATASLGDKVDEGDQIDGAPSLVGTVHGNTATLTFRSAWGATGAARLVLKQDKLYWTVRRINRKASWLPSNSTLQRSLTQSPLRDLHCPS